VGILLRLFLFIVVLVLLYKFYMNISHASETATCEQSRPKQEGKEQASNTYK